MRIAAVRRGTVAPRAALGAAILLAAITPSHADVLSEMNDFWRGAGVNTTGPTAFDGQASGHWTLGNLYLRAPVRSESIATVTLGRVTVPADRGFRARVAELLRDLVDAVRADTAPAGDALGLVNLTTLPVYRVPGHRHHGTTACYAHLANAHLVEAAEKVCRIVAEAMASAREI